MAESFSQLSAGLTSLKKRLSFGPKIGGIGPPGPLGFSEPRTRLRQSLDKDFGVAPRVGDPGFPDPVVPTPVTPLAVNDPTDLNIIAARRQSIEEQIRRRGRMSTVLTN